MHFHIVDNDLFKLDFSRRSPLMEELEYIWEVCVYFLHPFSVFGIVFQANFLTEHKQIITIH